MRADLAKLGRTHQVTAYGDNFKDNLLVRKQIGDSQVVRIVSFAFFHRTINFLPVNALQLCHEP